MSPTVIDPHSVVIRNSFRQCLGSISCFVLNCCYGCHPVRILAVPLGSVVTLEKTQSTVERCSCVQNFASSNKIEALLWMSRLMTIFSTFNYFLPIFG